MHTYILNEDGTVRKVSLLEWAAQLENDDVRRIGSDHIGPYFISTVFLGLDHNYGGGEPLLFETMIFSDDNEPGASEYCYRYHDIDEARTGHRAAVEEVKLYMAAMEGEALDPQDTPVKEKLDG